MTKQAWVFKMSVELKGLVFDAEYNITEGYYDRKTNEHTPAEVFLVSVKSKGNEVAMTYFEEEKIREYIKENHAFL